MAGPTEEDIAWFRSTFRPIPKPQLPDDCVEYSLYWIPLDGSSPDDVGKSDSIRTSLTEVQKYSSALLKQYLKGYVWQRDNFKLELTKEDDSDGEFLLVEAAAALPAWLEPDVADNRVWINKGELVIIKPGPSPGTKKKAASGKLTFRDARDIILTEPKRLMRSPTIGEEAFYRLRNYPGQIEKNLHSSLITIPRKIAHLLHTKPGYISPAIEAFYLRDPIALRPLQAKDSNKLVFEPENFVTVSVKFTKVGFAQLKSQDFPAPTKWEGRLPEAKTPKDSERAEIGMKLSCGFEMLLSDPQNRDKPSVREMKLILDDIEIGEERLPTDEEIKSSWGTRDDDESWLDISFEDLEGELKGRGGGEKAKKGGDFGDKAAQENLQRIVSKFEEFLNDDSAGYDGAGLIDEFGSDDSDGDNYDDDDEFSSDGEDKEASFNEEEFSRMMKEMMGMPSVSNHGSSYRPKRIQDLDEKSSDGEDDEDEIKDLSKQMEAELREAGFFDQLNASRTGSDGKKRAVKGKAPIRGDDTDGDNEEEGEVQELDDTEIDINLAKNLLESFDSQGGASGPGSNMLGMMGMRMPKDDRK
ncbi:ecdysoneless [Arthroderma uncinatum]|uniref:ecdysoneless n=1 Tax=Arthroderma uncinatum TaxID=74035 RepID=UPI00144A76A1|nr:ecdysoneless [Arthroderma uncinatum]KAF3490937.1 ecdysoneless [Arthroderma uncinatum]